MQIVGECYDRGPKQDKDPYWEEPDPEPLYTEETVLREAQFRPSLVASCENMYASLKQCFDVLNTFRNSKGLPLMVRLHKDKRKVSESSAQTEMSEETDNATTAPMQPNSKDRQDVHRIFSKLLFVIFSLYSHDGYSMNFARGIVRNSKRLGEMLKKLRAGRRSSVCKSLIFSLTSK